MICNSAFIGFSANSLTDVRIMQRTNKIEESHPGFVLFAVVLYRNLTLLYYTKENFSRADPWKFRLKPMPVQTCWQTEVQRQELRLMAVIWNKRFRMDRRRNIFSLRTTRRCMRLLRDPVLALLSEVFKTQLDKALSTQVWCHSWACLEQELELETAWCPFPVISGYVISRSEASSFSVQAQLDKDRKSTSLNWRWKDSHFPFLVWTSGPRINWINPVLVQQRVGN